MLLRPVHTYSIVARDPETGQLGVAVQSHYFSVGPVVPWVEAGVGAVATQSFVEVTYGPLGLEMMRAGKTARQALDGLLAADTKTEVRQVAMVDAKGNVAAHTGEKCIQPAGHRTGEGYSAQANLMRNSTVWDAMAEAYEAAEGDLAERLVVALEAAEGEGGDIRGKQSAALLVVTGEPTGRPWSDKLFDLRVDDHPVPLEELRRLLRIARAYRHADIAENALVTGSHDEEFAAREFERAVQLLPDIEANPEPLFWHAVALANAKKIDAALPIFRRVFAADPSWRDLVPRLVPAGLLADDKEILRNTEGS
ncbi:MAG: DUF1028 domain-containing protein [Chloroflexia bacterium]